MIVSYKLLQTYFDKKLPTPEALGEALTFHAFEIEGMELKGSDTAIDIKVLPNRAHDCLSHYGVAKEVGAILNIPLKKFAKSAYPKPSAKASKIKITLVDKRAIRYIGLTIEGVTVNESPEWLQQSLQSLRQRSINSVVDATNYVMFMLGQPLHAFDLAKLGDGSIVVRPGKDGEVLTTLDGKDVTLNKSIMVIADKKEVLGIAGIKGGTKAEVDMHTTSILLESANFDASTIRMSAQKIDIKTDASKRFESGLSPYTAEDAMKMVATLILDIAGNGDTVVGKPIDVFPKKPKMRTVSVSLYEINHILGTQFSDKDVQLVWKRLGFVYKAKKKSDTIVYDVTIPHERLDLIILQDLVEEVGRMAGYDALTPIMPIESVLAPEINKEWLCRDIVREIMLGQGYSDVYTYAFMGEGEIEVVNPISSDKKYLRNNLMKGLKVAVAENLKYESEVRVFEFGHVFGRTNGVPSEKSSFAALVGFQKRKEAQMKEDFYLLKGVLECVFEALAITGVRFEEGGGELIASMFVHDTLLGTMSINGFECDFSKLVDLSGSPLIYKVPSRYPSIIRDVSLFVPLSTKAGQVEAIIKEVASELMQSLTLIDIFEQPEHKRKSLAFRMVLQSFEKTLSDEEANEVSLRVAKMLTENDSSWQVRS